MAKYQYILVPEYKRGIWIFIGNHREFKHWVSDHFKDDEEYQGMIKYICDKEYKNAIANFWYDKNTGDGIIEIPKFPRSPEEIGYCAHECLHAVFNLLDFVGVKYDKESSGETHTYLLEYLLSNLLTLDNYKVV